MKKGIKIIAGFLMLVMLTLGMLVLPTDVKAAETTGAAVEVQEVVTYVKNADLAQEEKFDTTFGQSAPTKAGYFFGGWYDVNGEEKTPIKTGTQTINGEIYAKFVPAYVLSVKAQIHSGTEDTSASDDKTKMRVISSVDSLDYKKVGFELYLGEKLVGSQETKDVYSEILVTKNSETGKITEGYQATTLFGKAASKFISLNILNIDESLWEADLYARPYWITYDNVKVYGLGKYVYVRDGLDGIISIPVNLNTLNTVAAGVLNVKFDPEVLEYKECRAGNVFQEVAASVQTNGSIVKCVGNVADITENVSADGMYITLRFFKKDKDYDLASDEKFLNFHISGINFCDNQKNDVVIDVWNIQY